MRLTQVCLSIGILTLGIAFSSAQALANRGAQLLDCSGLPCVDVSVDGQSFRMLIDTGNENTMLDGAVAEKLGLTLQPVNGPDGKPYPGYQSGTMKNLEIGGAALGNVETLVVNMKPTIDRGFLPKCDGTLSYTAFKGKVLTLDYKNHLVGVSESQNAAPPRSKRYGSMSNLTFGRQGPHVVTTTGFEVNGKNVVMQIDTLYSGSMLIYPTSISRLGLGEEAKSVKMHAFPFTDGGVDMIEGKAASESFLRSSLASDGSIYFATPKVHLPDGMFDGTVGLEVLEGHVLTFDFGANRFWMI